MLNSLGNLNKTYKTSIIICLIAFTVEDFNLKSIS